MEEDGSAVPAGEGVVKKLFSDLPPELLRGVPCDVALEGYGRHWQGIAGGPHDFFLSKPTRGIDDFISHDWRTPRTTKYLALCYTYNARASIIGGTLIAGITVLAKEATRRSRDLELTDNAGIQLADMVAFSVVGPLAFLAVFFHWQRILRCLGQASILLFVDKLCISQHNDEKKSQGILGLASFLKRSRRLVVLWSPTYFSRLWCTYELAAWFRYEKPLSSIRFLPVEIPSLLLAGFLAIGISSLVYYIELLMHWKWMALSITTQFSAWVFFAYHAQVHIQHIFALRRELESFEVQRCSCYCCSHDHRHPESGKPLMCDRAMVDNALKSWSDKSEADAAQGDDHLSCFNREVSTTLKQYTFDALPERQAFLRYGDFLFMFLPYVWMLIDSTAVNHARGYPNMWLHFTTGLVLFFATLPLAMNIFMRMIYAAPRGLRRINQSRQGRLVLAFVVWGPVGFFLYLLLWQFVRAQLYLQLGAIWLLCPAIALELLLTYCLFAKSSGRSRPVPRDAAVVSWTAGVNAVTAPSCTGKVVSGENLNGINLEAGCMTETSSTASI
eukprot:TRINITY_DN18430_c0_g1_i5.p1 TRINITY_DN18430_c0_g1~~TRINITY_DN18430_c0_g1_i5.p1  ORF type:complete len:558 (+),score=29.50 TRINITY_DN18430_c0_g1_i5:109-1782(+)